MMKLKGIILAVIISLASIMMPFSVYADTISSSNIHLNTSLISVNYDRNPYFYNYKYEFVFDKQYVGWVSVNVVSTYYSDNNFNTTQSTFQKAIYVNGGTASITNGFYSTGNYASGCLVSASFSIVNSNVIEYSVINSLNQITDILTDISNYVSIDVLQELENIVSNTSLSNDYLETISNLRYYDIPVESFPYIVYCDKRYDTLEYLNQSEFYYTYPIYEITNNYGFNTYLNKSNGEYIDVVYLVSELDANGNTFTQTATSVVSNVSNKDLYFCSYTYNSRNVYLYLRWRRYYINSSGYFRLSINSSANALFCPIYVGYEGNMNISTEFALRYNLSNKLLDNIQTIANGTNQSNQAASALESGNSQMADDMDDLASIENEYNQQFNSQLQQIDFTSPLQSNAGILPAANFVITIFNGLINNNPFSVLIIIVCILLIGKKVIGK